MKKTVWLVTHAETDLRNSHGEWLPDPEMGLDAYTTVVNLRPVLHDKLQDELPTEVHCGTGKRQWQVAQALGFRDPERVFFSSLWGEAATLAPDDGRRRMILLSHGLLVNARQYITGEHVGGKTIRGVIASLPNDSVICSGRPVLVRLGMEVEGCHSGALYALNVQDNGEIAIELVQQGKILAS